jgi:hypothetical protein
MVDESTYITPATFSDSCQAAAVALELLAAVLAQPGGTCAFFLGRPPGHHVLAQRPMGFGSLNIISVAAAQALQHPGISKVPPVLAGHGCVARAPCSTLAAGMAVPGQRARLGSGRRSCACCR